MDNVISNNIYWYGYCIGEIEEVGNIFYFRGVFDIELWRIL